MFFSEHPLISKNICMVQHCCWCCFSFFAPHPLKRKLGGSTLSTTKQKNTIPPPKKPVLQANCNAAWTFTKAAAPQQHRYTNIYIGPDSGIGERICQGIIQRRQFNQWLPVEVVSAPVYGPLGQTPLCPLAGTADADTGQCLIPKCDGGCPVDGGNPSNPIASASGHKRHIEADYQGAGIFPLAFTRTWSSHRAAAGQTSPLGTGWTHSYSARLSPIADSNGAITRIRAHRPNGAIQTFTLQNGQWLPDADVPERLTVALTADGSLQSASYHRRDDSVEGYNQHGRLTHITTFEGHTHTLGGSIRYALDSAGNRTAERIYDANNTLRHSLTRSYNLLGRLQNLTDAFGASSQYTYSAGGIPSEVSDPLGRITKTGHDRLNRLTAMVQDATGIAAEIHHNVNALHQRTQTTDPKGLVTYYKINALGNLLAQSNPDNGETSYNHDSAGNVIAQTDANGHTRHTSYDSLHRATSVTYPNAPHLNVSYQYDTAPSVCTANESYHTGRLAQMHDASGSTSYCYNRFGDLTRKVQNTEGTTRTLQHSYHASGQLHTIQYPDGTLIDHIYDSAGRIQEIGSTKIPQPRQIVVTGIQYAPFGEPVQWQYGNGRTLTRTLDQNYRHTSIEDNASDGLNLHYSYDAAGNISQLQTGSATQSLHYDGIDRLLAKNNENYHWDKTGNRLSFSDGQNTHNYDYPSNNHWLQAVNGTTRQYDNAGNTVTIGANSTFQYGADNRLASVTRNGSITWYLYNGHGERVSRKSETDSSITRSLYLEDGRWLGDYDYQVGQPIQQIVWLHDWPVAVLDYQTTAEALHYIEPDHLGTPRVVIEQDRNLAVWTWSITGEAFGNTPPDEDPDGDGIPFQFDMRFPGQRFDNASGLNYNYFRDYESTTGRYTLPMAIR